MSEKIVVVARYKVQPGMEVIARQELEDMATLNRKAPGCLGMELHRDKRKAALFMTISRWNCMDDFMKLLSQPHIKEYAEKSKKLLEEPFEVTIWDPLDLPGA